MTKRLRWTTRLWAIQPRRTKTFTAMAGTLTFRPGGELYQMLTVTVLDDVLDEENESFTVTLSNARNAEIGDGTATGTIEDDDDPPGTVAGEGLSIANATIVEGGSLSFAVSLGKKSGREVTVGWSTSDGTATSLDYEPANGLLSFAAGEVEKTITVATIDDALDEDDETVFVELSNAMHAGVDDPSATGTIEDDDGVPGTVAGEGLTIADAFGAEGESISFTVSLGTASGRPVSVDWSTSDGNATNADYTPESGTLDFAPGETERTLVVSTVGDALDEDDETFHVTLTNAENAAVERAHATGTIIDDDHAPGRETGGGLSIADASATEGEDLSFTVSLGTVSGREVRIDWQTFDGSATSEDYTPASGTLAFAAGETEKTITIPTTDDELDEVDETVVVGLSSPINAGISKATATGTIHDNDLAPEPVPVEETGALSGVNWLAWFNRATAGQTVDALDDRLREAPRGPRAVLRGITLQSLGRQTAASLVSRQELYGWTERESRLGGFSTARELLETSSFYLPFESDADIPDVAEADWVLWGYGSALQFEDEQGDLSLDGGTASFRMGFDGEWDQILAGLSVTRTTGTATFERTRVHGTPVQRRDGGQPDRRSSLLAVYTEFASAHVHMGGARLWDRRNGEDLRRLVRDRADGTLPDVRRSRPLRGADSPGDAFRIRAGRTVRRDVCPDVRR